MVWRTFFVVLLFWSASVMGATSQQIFVLAVDGMTCPLCVAAVNKALRTTDGVLSAKTNLVQTQAEVQVEAGLQAQVLIEAVKKAGYDAHIIQVNSVEETIRD